MLRGFFNGLFVGLNIGEIDIVILFVNEVVFIIWLWFLFLFYFVCFIYYVFKVEVVKLYIGGGIVGIVVILVLFGL